MIQVDDTFLSLKVISFFNMRVGVIDHACGCDACAQARGRIPARRVRKKNEGDQRSAVQLAADFTCIAGRHWSLILLMLHTQMMEIVVMTGDRDNDIKSVASVLNEIGVGGLSIEVATDNERYLVKTASSLTSRLSRIFNHFSIGPSYRLIRL